MKKLQFKNLRLEAKEKLFFRLMSLLLITIAISSFSNCVFGAELLVIDDNLYQYIDTDNSTTVNLGDKIILDNELFWIMAADNGIIYALADEPLNESGDKQEITDDYKANTQATANGVASKYFDTLVGEGFDIKSVKLLGLSQAEKWLGFEFSGSSSNIGGSASWYKRTSNTPEFAYKNSPYWLYYGEYMYRGSSITNSPGASSGAFVLPVIAVNSDCLNKQFKIICDDPYVSVSNIENEIYLTLKPKDGYILTSIKAYSSKREEIDIVDNKFTMIRDDVTIETKYEVAYNVIFNTNGGSKVETQVLASGDKATMPNVEPTKENYIFDNWYTDNTYETLFDFDSVITADTTIYAKWNEKKETKYIVKFNTNGGSKIDAQEVTSGDKVVKPSNPQRSGYIFDGWYVDSSLTKKFDFNTVINANIELFAKWSKKSTNGGSGSSSKVKYQITVIQNECGKITPDTLKVERGSNVSFKIEAETGYEVEDVIIDGKSIGKLEEYTFKGVNKKHTIEAKFKKVEVKESWKNKYEDIKENDWFYEAIRFVDELKIFNGMTETKFEPNSIMNRAMSLTVIYRLAGMPKAENQINIFNDVEEGTYYYEAIIWAIENGIVNGVTESEFAPQDNVTREQLVAMLYRYVKTIGSISEESVNLSAYDDNTMISDYAREAFDWAVKNGLITGRTTSTLAPQSFVTRAEVATIMMRFYKIMNVAK